MFRYIYLCILYIQWSFTLTISVSITFILLRVQFVVCRNTMCVKVISRTFCTTWEKERRLLTYTNQSVYRLRNAWLSYERDPFILIGISHARKKCEWYRLITAFDLYVLIYVLAARWWNLESISADGTKRRCMQSHVIIVSGSNRPRGYIKHSTHFLPLKTKHWSSLLRSYI